MLRPRRQLLVDCDFNRPFMNGYYYCRYNKMLFRAYHLLLQDPRSAKALLGLLQDLTPNFRGVVNRTRHSIVFTLFAGRFIAATATYDLFHDTLIDVRSYQRRSGLARMLVGFICRHFGPRHITARASLDEPGAPTYVLLPFYASFGYQIIPNSDRLILMPQLAEIIREDKADLAEESEEMEGKDGVEEAGADPLDSDETLALTAVRAAVSRNDSAKLAQLYRLLHKPNSDTVNSLLASQDRTPAALLTATTIYTVDWFDNQPWADYHKSEFAAGMLQMIHTILGQTNIVWERYANLSAD
jgi:hypothetical protein